MKPQSVKWILSILAGGFGAAAISTATTWPALLAAGLAGAFAGWAHLQRPGDEKAGP